MAAVWTNDGTVTLTNCTVSGNTAGFGGGMSNSGTANLTGCTLSGNTAYYRDHGSYSVYDIGTGGGVLQRLLGQPDPDRLHLHRQLRWRRRRHVQWRHGQPDRDSLSPLTDCNIGANSGGWRG